MQSKAPPARIETERLWLVQPQFAMAEAIFAAIDADRARLQTYLPWVRDVRVVADEQAFILLSEKEWAKHSCFAWAMLDKADGSYVGNCGLVRLVWEHRYAELGYWVRGACEGRGFVSEAAIAVEAAARALGLHRMEIHCSTHNARSAAVPQRLGYALEGVCREDFYDVGAGRYHDTAIYGKLLEASTALAPGAN